ncbi:glycosyltransferase [Clostridioides sp. GD02404]|uniref:glycosyltransferase n=1 Tax=Clostridioides sp. GD02404 TaxID=3054354 RepID=UPI0038A5274F
MVVDIVIGELSKNDIFNDIVKQINRDLKTSGNNIRILQVCDNKSSSFKEEFSEDEYYLLNNKVDLIAEYKNIINIIGFADIFFIIEEEHLRELSKRLISELEIKKARIVSIFDRSLQIYDYNSTLKDKINNFTYEYEENELTINIINKSRINMKNFMIDIRDTLIKYFKSDVDVLSRIEELIKNNSLEEALDSLYYYNDRFCNNIEFINMKSILAMQMNEYDIAINLLEYAKSMLKEDNIDIYYNLAHAYYKNHDWDKSIDEYNHLLDIIDRNEKLHIKDLITEVYNSINIEFEEIYKKDNIFIEDKYGKVILDNNFHKKLPKKLEDFDNMYEVRENINKLKEGDNPLVSIWVLGYNNLEKYTKRCVESILKYTNDIDYELILFDNGSSDGTYEYFKSINYSRKKIIKVIKNFGVGYSFSTAFREMSGRYIVFVCNDVVVTTNWLSNMIKCAESDSKIGIVHPACNHAPLEYKMEVEYKDLDDMQSKAELYNISNPRKWYEIFDLYTVATLFKRECIDVIGIYDYGYVHHTSDVDISFRARRGGYKVIACTDTFVCNIGEKVDKGSNFDSISRIKGPKFFKEKYHIDIVDAISFDYTMVSMVKADTIFNREYSVLGIDTSCGVTILQIKNKLLEKGASNVNLAAFSEEAKYWLDLKTICENVVVDRIEYFHKHYRSKNFDYIVVGKILNSYKDMYDLLNNLYEVLNDEGKIILKLKNNSDITEFLRIKNVISNSWNEDSKNVNIEIFNNELNNCGLYIESINFNSYNFNNDIEEKVKELLDDSNISAEQRERLYISEYILKIKKVSK